MEELRATITFLRAEVESSDGEIKESCEAALQNAHAKLAALINAVEITPTQRAPTTSETYKRNSQIKSIESALSETKFSGKDINETTRFVERLEKIFIITVIGKDPSLESDFLDLVKLRLSDAVFKNLHASQADVSTFEKLKSWLKTTYGGNFNAFQILQRAWDIEFKPSEKFATYAQKVSEEMRTGVAAVRKQITAVKGEKQHPGGDPQFAAGHKAGRDAGLEDAMEFVSALLVSNNLRAHCWPIYKDMVNDMDTMLTSTEVANKAEYYRERLGGANADDSAQAYWAKPNHSNGQNSSSKQNQGRSKKSKGQKTNTASSTAKLGTGKRSFDPKIGRPCKFCQQPHWDYDCPTQKRNNAMHASGTDHAPVIASVYAPTTPFQ